MQLSAMKSTNPGPVVQKLMQTAEAPKPDGVCHLLRLPAELHVLICVHLLKISSVDASVWVSEKGHPYKTWQRGGGARVHGPGIRRLPPFARTCSSLYEIAIQAFWDQAIVKYDFTNHSMNRYISQNTARLPVERIRYLCFKYWHLRSASTLPRFFPNLEHLELDGAYIEMHDLDLKMPVYAESTTDKRVPIKKDTGLCAKYDLLGGHCIRNALSYRPEGPILHGAPSQKSNMQELEAYMINPCLHVHAPAKSNPCCNKIQSHVREAKTRSYMLTLVCNIWIDQDPHWTLMVGGLQCW